MNQLPMFDIAVIGGGLAGLTAAVVAGRAGRSVIVFEKGPQPGGRAATQNTDGYFFNQGPHALYRGGEGIEVLHELGIQYEGAKASYDGSWIMRGGHKFPMPGSPDLLQRTALFREESKVEAVAILAGLMNPSSALQWNHTSLREWLDTQIVHDDVRGYFEAMFRLATYCNEAAIQSAGAAMTQMFAARDGVDYLDGGWQTLVDRLREAALAAGVRIEVRSDVKGIRCSERNVAIRLANDEYFQARSAIVTATPATTARMVNDGGVPSLNQCAGTTIPIHAACLDVALRTLPNSEHLFAIGADRPIYYSVHTRSARLAPEGGSVIQLAKYLSASSKEPANDVREELEGVLDWLQPGWRDVLVAKRFLPRMVVSNAVVTSAQGGTAGRPAPAVPEHPNLFMAGDWVGPFGMLADASLASARSAANLAVQFVSDSKAELAQVS